MVLPDDFPRRLRARRENWHETTWSTWRECLGQRGLEAFSLLPSAPWSRNGFTFLQEDEEGPVASEDTDDGEHSGFLKDCCGGVFTGTAEPHEGGFLPGMPFPVLPLRYPGGAADVFAPEMGAIHRPPPGQSILPDGLLDSVASSYLQPGGDLRKGFYFDTGLRSYDEEDVMQDIKSAVERIRAGISGGWWPGRKKRLVRALTIKEAFGDRAEANYARLVSRHSYTIDLATALIVVCLKSFDVMCFIQLCISLWLNANFAQLRDEAPEMVVGLTAMLLLSNVVWVYFAYRQMTAAVVQDIDYIGDLVWRNNNEGMKPVDDRVASNFAVRASMLFINLFEVPYLVKEVANLCHPRKGAMQFGAFGGWGRIPRTIALGYKNKLMFEYEEKQGTLSTIPHIVMAKLPTVFLKVFIYLFYQQTWILGMSIFMSSALILVKLFSIVSYIFKARTFRDWMLENYDEGPVSQSIIFQRKLCHDFYFTIDDAGRPVDSGMIGWLLQLLPIKAEKNSNPEGFMQKWGGSRKSFSRICSTGGSVRIPDSIIAQLKLASPKGEIQTEFWYRADGTYVHDDPTSGSYDTDWKYARIITVPSFTRDLSVSLIRGYLNGMYMVGMCNLCLFLMGQEAFTEFALSMWVFIIFAVTRVTWLLLAVWQSQQGISVDWKEVGDFMTNVGFLSRMKLAVASTVIHMFVIPKQVREAVSLFHPEKNVQPFCAFGGRNHGPRAFAIGYANKDMYITESYQGFVAQVPLLLADGVITVALGWTLAIELGFLGAEKRNRYNTAENMCERANIVALLLTSIGLISSRLSGLRKYVTAHYKFRRWVEQRMQDENVTEDELHALRKQWRLGLVTTWIGDALVSLGHRLGLVTRS